MKEQIQAKIQEIVEYIIRKPVEEVTLDEYTILVNELREIQNKENQADNSKRMAELVAMATAPSNSLYGTK